MTTFANDLLKQITPPTSTIPALGKGITLDDLPGDDGSDQPSVPDSRTPTGKSLDDFIAQNRLVTPAEVVNKRKVQRSTIAEMNQTDPDALRARLFSMHRDDRSPVIKVLDLIDAPRNIILSHLAPKLRVAAQERGDTGAFGLGRVNMSDVLRELGINNRIAAGILGFVGDVVFDPLTYIGPAGWGAELVGKTAQGTAKVGLRAAGTKALKREIAKVAAGSAEIGDDAARAYLVAKGFTPERVADLAGKGLAAHEIQSMIAKATFGDQSKSLMERLFRPLGGERTFGLVDNIPEDLRGIVTTGGGLADDFLTSEGPVSDAARKFVEKYVAGGGKALRIGTGGEIGTQVAHVPFLSQYTVQVPRFTHGAAINARNLALAKAAGQGVGDAVGLAADPLVNLTHRIAETTSGVHDDLEARVFERAQHEELRKNLSDDLPPSPPPPPDAGGPTGPVGPQPTPIVPGMDDGLSLPPNAPERTSNFIVDSAAATPAPRPEQGRIAFDIDARAQEILDNGDALDEDDARHMAQIEAEAWERNNPPTTETAGGPTSTTPSPTAGGLPGAGATGDANVFEEGRQEGREGLLSPPAAATTTPPAAQQAAGGITSHRERVLGEARAAFSDRPQEELDAFAALVDARAKAMVQSGQIKHGDELWSSFSIGKGADGKNELYQPALHGSPHRFGIDDAGRVVNPKAFSISAIGSGEGAQAYTRGLYFTQSDDVQRHYRNLGMRDRYLLNNTLVDHKTIAQRVLNLAESYMSASDATDIQRRISSALNRGGPSSALEAAESAHLGKYFDHWTADALSANPDLFKLAHERHGWERSNFADLAADVKASPLASTGDAEIDSAIRATLPDFKPDSSSDPLVHLLSGLEDPPRETRVALRPRDGARAMKSMSESDKSSLFEIEARMHWAHGTTPAEKLKSVKNDLRRTVEVQSDWKARYEREWADRFGGTPRLLTQAETNQIVDDIEKAILTTLGSGDDIADAHEKVLRDLSYWNEVDHYKNGNLLADGTIRTQAIEDMLKRHLGASDAAKVIASEAWSAVESGLSRPSAYHYWDEAASTMKNAQNVLDFAEKYDIQAVKLVKPGATYKVELAPTDEDLVWWDKPISENPAKVQQAVLDMYPIDPNNWEEGKMGAADGRHFLRWDGPSGVGVVGIVTPELNGMWAAHSGTQMPNANNLIDHFASLDDAKAAVAAQAHKAVDEYLSTTKAGTWLKKLERDRGVMAPPTELLKRDVRGVKYLDGMSRADGHGTYNFVIYDDKDVTITDVLLQKRGGEPRASIRWEDGHAFIRALKSPNVSSLFHETGHLFLPTLTAAEHAVVAKVYKVDPKLLAMTSVEAKKTPARFKKWAAAHEQWANDFEKYLSSGKAPTPELQSIFDKMKQWFIDLYKQIVGSPLEKEIDPKIRGVMDRMLGGVDDGSGLATPSGKVTRSVVWDRLRDSTADARGIISDMEMVADESMQDFAHATVFHEMTTELKMALQRPGGDSLRRQFIRIDPTRRSGGWDAIMDRFGGDAEKYVDWLEELAGSEKSKVLRAARMSEQQGNPAAPFWLALWEHWPVKGRKATVAKMDTIDAATIGPDVAFSFHGMPLRTMQNEDGAVVIAYEGREVPAELVGSLPVDPGSVRRLTEEEIAAMQGVDDTNLYQRDVAGQEGLFGSRVGKIGDGREQGSLFGQPPEEVKPSNIPVGEPERMLNESDDAYKARLAQHRKWAESARNTGTLFQGGPPPDPNTLPLGNLPPRSAEDARWSEREKQIESAIGEKLSHLRMLKQESDDALAAFEAASAAGEVSNMNDVLRIGEMLGDAQAAVDDAISANHLSQMMVAATTPDATGLRLIDTGDPADLAEQLGEHLYHLAVTDPDSAEQLAEAARARMEAAMNYRESLRSTLQAVSDRQTGHMADLAKAMLSTDDESIALSAFGPVARFLGERFGIDSKAYAIADGMDRFWRRTFGVRRGFVHQAIAETRGQYSKGSISERMHATARLALKAQGLDIPGVPSNEATHLLYLWTVQRLDPERLRFFWNKIGKDGQDLGKSDLLLALDKFQGAGGFSPESQAKLNAAADEFIAEMRSMGLSEQSQGILGLIRDPYLPAKATDESQKAMFEHAAAGSVGKGDKAGWPTQGFQRAKTTDQVRYPDPLNPKRTRRFFVGQMYLADTPDKHLDQEALSIKRAVVDYLEMAKADPAFAMAHQPRPTDALELNALYSEGTNFQHLTGGKPLEQLFDTDIAAIYGKRMGDHVRAQSMQDLGRLVLAHGYQIGDMLDLDRNGARVGMTGKLRGGTDVTIAGLVPSNMGGQAHGVRIGDTLYRRLDPRIWNSMDDNVFAQMLGRLPTKIDDLVLHHAVADQIEDVVKLGAPDQLEKILRAADNITGLWKQLTLFHPSWVVGNIVGDTMNAVVGGADPLDLADPRIVRDMIRLRTSMHAPEKLKDMVVTLKTGQEIPASDLLRMFTEHRIIDNNLTAEAMLAIGRQNPGLFSTINDRYLSRVMGPWFKTNQHIQDVMRMTAFVSFLNQGHDAISAQRNVLRSMFDYGDFTRVEERAFRRLFPFYSWMRSNVGYQLAMLGQRPAYAALMAKLQPALEEMMAGEAAVPDGQRPSWLRNALAVQVGTDPNFRFAVTLGTLLPQGDLFQVLTPILGTDGALNFMHYFSSNLTPNLTVPLQLGTGTEFFSGRTIGGDNLSGDMSAGEMLRSQVRPLAEIGNIAKAYRQGGAAQAVGRGVLGGRVQSFDQGRLDSSVRREFRDREERLRSAIRRSERRGDSETSLEARARLMDLYRDALKRGLEDVVPAWAEEQLAQLTE